MAPRRKATPSKQDKARTTAHLAETISENLGHAKRHAAAMSGTKAAGSKEFNKQHMNKHLQSAAEHTAKLKRQVGKNPAVKREQAALKKAKP